MPNFNIAILDYYQQVALSMADWPRLPSEVSIEVFHEHFDNEEILIQALQDKNAVVLMRERTPFHGGIFEALPNLKLVVTSGPHNAAIDLKAAEKNQVLVCGTNNLKAPPAELTIGLMFALARHIPHHFCYNRITFIRTLISLLCLKKGYCSLSFLSVSQARLRQIFICRLCLLSFILFIPVLVQVN